MKLKQEKKLLELLKSHIDKKNSYKKLVALDADGTLWPEDANEILLQYQIQKGFKNFKCFLSPYYQKNRSKLCEDFMKKQEGFSLKKFKMICEKALQAQPLHVFSFQKKLLKYLKKKRMKIYIVTASIKWLVETALRLYRLPVDEVLGMETRLDRGIISRKIIRPTVTFSKEIVFLKKSQGEACFLAGGNTLNDRPLLEMAELAFVVHSAQPKSPFFAPEKKLRNLALKNHWPVFERI